MLKFKVFRESGSSYTVAGHDGPRALTPGAINTFKVAIPVQGGDTIGLNDLNASEHPNACLFAAGDPLEDIIREFEGDAADASPVGSEATETARRVNVSATLLQPPEINIPGRVSLGSIAGGGTVVLNGLHFEEVSAVSFGGVAASKFTVNSDQQITAIAPPGRTLSEIPAAVTTPAGTAVAPSRFAYSGCRVPKLVGKKLSAAKAKIKKAGCKLGKLKRVHASAAKRGRVLKQKPKPGKLGAPGTKVRITVGR
jgi:hypothetical protein